MKPTPAPHVPGNKPSERLSNAVKSIFNVSKEDLLKAEAKEKAKKSTEKPKHETA
jgi:hypothetical protein